MSIEAELIANIAILALNKTLARLDQNSAQRRLVAQKIQAGEEVTLADLGLGDTTDRLLAEGEALQDAAE